MATAPKGVTPEESIKNLTSVLKELEKSSNISSKDIKRSLEFVGDLLTKYVDFSKKSSSASTEREKKRYKELAEQEQKSSIAILSAVQKIHDITVDVANSSDLSIEDRARAEKRLEEARAELSTTMTTVKKNLIESSERSVEISKNTRMSSDLLYGLRSDLKEVSGRVGKSMLGMGKEVLLSASGPFGVIGSILYKGLGLSGVRLSVGKIFSALNPIRLISASIGKKFAKEEVTTDIEDKFAEEERKKKEGERQGTKKIIDILGSINTSLIPVPSIDEDLISIYSDFTDQIDVIDSDLVSIYSDFTDQIDVIDSDLVSIYSDLIDGVKTGTDAIDSDLVSIYEEMSSSHVAGEAVSEKGNSETVSKSIEVDVDKIGSIIKETSTIPLIDNMTELFMSIEGKALVAASVPPVPPVVPVEKKKETLFSKAPEKRAVAGDGLSKYLMSDYETTEDGMKKMGGAIGAGFSYLGSILGGSTGDEKKKGSDLSLWDTIKKALIGAGIATAITLLIKSGAIDKIKDAVAKIVEFTKTTVIPFLTEKVVPFIKEKIFPVFVAIKDFFVNKVFPFLTEKVVPFIKEKIFPVFVAIKDFVVNTVVPFIKEKIVPAISAAVNFIVKKVVPAVSAVVSTVYTVVKDYVVPAVMGIFTTGKAFILGIVNVVTKYIIPPVKSVFQFVEKIFVNICGFVKKYLIAPIKSVFSGIAKVVGKIVSFFKEKLLGGILSFLEKIPFIGGKIKEAISPKDTEETGVIDTSGLDSTDQDEKIVLTDTSSLDATSAPAIDIDKEVPSAGAVEPLKDEPKVYTYKDAVDMYGENSMAAQALKEKGPISSSGKFLSDMKDTEDTSKLDTFQEKKEDRVGDIVSAIKTVLPDVAKELKPSIGSPSVTNVGSYMSSDMNAILALRGI